MKRYRRLNRRYRDAGSWFPDYVCPIRSGQYLIADGRVGEEAWREQCREQLDRNVMTRIKYGFCMSTNQSWMTCRCGLSRRWPNTARGVSSNLPAYLDIDDLENLARFLDFARNDRLKLLLSSFSV